MSIRSYQKFLVNSADIDEIKFDSVPKWLLETLLKFGTPVGSRDTARDVLHMAAYQHGDGDWLQSFATARFGDDQTLVILTNDLDVAMDFAAEFELGIEVLHAGLLDGGEVVCFSADPAEGVINSELAASAVEV